MKFFRLMYIGWILARYRIDGLLLTTPWFYPFRFFRLCNPFYYIPRRKQSRGLRIRLALEKLGPIFVKFGQVLSTRRDWLPEDIADELEKLQDDVKPFPGKKARAMIRKSLKKPVSELFKRFSDEALASASIAQVHAAELMDGTKIVVKVLRPNVDKQVECDISLLKLAARFCEAVLPKGNNARPMAIIEEFERNLKSELDLTLEAANAAQLRRNIQATDLAYVPDVYWEFCAKNVLALERVTGIPIAHMAALKTAKVDLKKLAERAIEMFFTQVFRDNFFHADLHPGNIFVSKKKPCDPTFVLVDFGVAGTLSPKDQRYIAENLLAFFKRDYQRVADLHVASGWLPVDTRAHEFATQIRAISEPFFEKPLKDISIGMLLLRLFQTARRFHIIIQPQLILLQKNLLHIEGISRQLDPDLDLWQTAKPFLENWLKKQIGPKAVLRKVCEQLPYWGEKLPELPELVYQFLQQTKTPTSPVLTEPAKKPGISRRLAAGAICLFASALIFAVAPQAHIAGWILFGLGVGSAVLNFVC